MIAHPERKKRVLFVLNDIKALCYNVNNYQLRMNDMVKEISNRTKLLFIKLNFCWTF